MQEYITVQDLAKQKRVSTTAIYKKIYAGELRAERMGRQYFILREEADRAQFRRKKRNSTEKVIQRAVSRVVNEYVDAFKMLGED